MHTFRKIIIFIFLVLIFNFFYLSVGYGQNNVNVSGFVPETEKNRITTEEAIKQGVTKENKYYYFFEKYWEIEKAKESPYQTINNQSQTIYDKISSYSLMLVLLIIAGLVIVFILRFIDKFLFR